MDLRGMVERCGRHESQKPQSTSFQSAETQEGPDGGTTLESSFCPQPRHPTPIPRGLVEAIATQILCAICPPLRSISLNLTATLGSVPGLFSFFLS